LDIEPAVMKDEWHQLTSNTNQPQDILLRVRTFFIPNVSTKPPVKRLPPYRIQLNKSAFVPGDKIDGNAVLNLSKPTKINDISLSVIGFTKTTWNQGENTYECILPVLNRLIKLYQPHPSTRKYKLPDTCYKWAFTLVLPDKLPPSLAYPSSGCYTFYQIAINLSGRPVYKHSFTVLPEFSKCGIPPERPYNLKEKKLLDVQLIDQEYLPIGENVNIKLQITNNTNYNINQIMVKLVLHTMLYGPSRLDKIDYNKDFSEWESYLRSGFKSLRKKLFSEIVVYPKDKIMAPGEILITDIPILIPRGSVSSLPVEVSPLISSEYVLELSYTKGKIKKKNLGNIQPSYLSLIKKRQRL